tara:strand:+ start:1143 stop:1658 length:516 start_codon:yes stop_codon:yes gene_type:complete
MAFTQVATNTVTSAVSTVTLTGINTDDVYAVVMTNVRVATDARSVSMRVTKSGSADTTSNYDMAYKSFNATGGFGDAAHANYSSFRYLVADNLGTNTGESGSAIIYLYSFNNSSKYSYITSQVSEINSSGTHRGNQGGGMHTVASASDGVQFVDVDGGNISAGTFTLYKVT